MKSNDEIRINKIKLDNHDVPVPEGLSELLNSSDSWMYLKGSSNQKNKNEEIYDRKVVLEDGKLKTYLILKVNLENQSKAVS